jgi:hypothetical protein
MVLLEPIDRAYESARRIGYVAHHLDFVAEFDSAVVVTSADKAGHHDRTHHLGVDTLDSHSDSAIGTRTEVSFDGSYAILTDVGRDTDILEASGTLVIVNQFKTSGSVIYPAIADIELLELLVAVLGGIVTLQEIEVVHLFFGKFSHCNSF